MSYLKGKCGVTRYEGESNETCMKARGLVTCASQVKCGVVEWVKKKYIEVAWPCGEDEAWRVCEKKSVSEIEGHSRRGRSLGRWRDRIKEYMSKRGASRGGGLEKTMRECFSSGRQRCF